MNYVYGKEKLLTVTSIQIKDNYLIITFSDGANRMFDTNILKSKGNAFAELDNRTAFIDAGLLCWNNGDIDCSTDYIYAHSEVY